MPHLATASPQAADVRHHLLRLSYSRPATVARSWRKYSEETRSSREWSCASQSSTRKAILPVQYMPSYRLGEVKTLLHKDRKRSSTGRPPISRPAHRTLDFPCFSSSSRMGRLTWPQRRQRLRELLDIPSDQDVDEDGEAWLLDDLLWGSARRALRVVPDTLREAQSTMQRTTRLSTANCALVNATWSHWE